MAAPLLTLQKIDLSFGGAPLLEGAELSIAAGTRVALVGRNGSGKSTLLKIAAGLVDADGGDRFVQPGATVRYLPQEPDLSGFATVLEYVEAGLTAGDVNYRAQYLLENLGLTGEESPSNLSGGESRRAALARVLAPEPDILMLDEPTNHLDLPAIEWLQEELASLRSAMIIISHDRRFLTDLTRTTVWLDRGQVRQLSQGFGHFEAWRDKTLEEEEEARHKLDRQIVREEHWVRYGVTARRKRNVRRMADLANLRQKRGDQRKATGNVNISVTEGKTSGAIIMDAKNVSKSFGERKIVDDLTIRVLRGDRIGIVGSNGAGKTTLIKLLTGELVPDDGTIKLGTNLEVATLDQKRASLSPETTLKDALTGGGADFVDVGGQKRHFASYMKDFLFTPEQAGTAVGKLSGGERARVTLARALSLPSNLLVLDEPTNDLDLETLDLLQEMVSDYHGTVVVVSHDRDFLDRVVTTTLLAEGDGRWTEYAGGYSDMMVQRSRAAKIARQVQKTARAEKTTVSAEQPTAAPSPSVQKRKLSFKEQHALKTLPGVIEKLNKDIVDFSEKLASPNFYTKDPEGFAKITERLDRKQVELNEAEEAWMTVELLREELETKA